MQHTLQESTEYITLSHTNYIPDQKIWEKRKTEKLVL